MPLNSRGNPPCEQAIITLPVHAQGGAGADAGLYLLPVHACMHAEVD